MNVENNPPQGSVFILGASGHGKVILSNCLSSGLRVFAFLDDNSQLHKTIFVGLPILGNLDEIRNFQDVLAVIAVGNNSQRKVIAQKFSNITWTHSIHRSSFIDSSVKIGSGAAIMAGAVVQLDTVIGDHSIINTGTTVDHDCIIGNYVHLAPGVHLAGNVTIGDESFVAIGSQVIQGVSIGCNTYIGAGSTVLGDLPDNVLAHGTPARVVRSLKSN